MKLDIFNDAGRVAPAYLVALCLLANGCTVGPKYQKVAEPTAPTYKEVDTSSW